MKKFLAMIIAVTMLVATFQTGVVQAAAMEYGEEDLGSPIQSTRLIAAVNTVMDGKPVMMAVNTGVPAQLMIVDLATKTTIDAVDLPYGRAFHTMVTDSKGDVYLAGYEKAHLYKYSVSEKALTDLGSLSPATAVCQMAVDENDNIYMGTYPNSRIMKYSPTTGAIEALAQAYDDDNYCKSLAYYDGALYCGGYQAGTKLVKYDIASGEKTSFDLPATSIQISSLSTMSVAGDRLFINTTTASWAQHWLVFDLANEQWKPTIEGAGASYASKEKDGYTYLAVGGYVHKYKLADDTHASTGMVGSRVRTVDFADVNGQSVLIDYNDASKGDIVFYNVDTCKRTEYSNVVAPSPDIIEGMLVDDGKIYTAGFMGQGGGSVYDIAGKKTTTLKSGGIFQAHAIEKVGDKVYFGSYPTAGLSVYDTTKPVSSSNPASLFSHKDLNGARPMDIVAAGDKIVMSLIAGYGETDGALIVYDTVTGSNTVYSGDSFIKGHSPVGLWYDEKSNKVYGTTTVFGGLNSTPVEQKAKLFAFDMATNTVTAQAVPYITPQATHPDEVMAMCGGLAQDPTESYKLWCISDGLLFSFDKADFTVIDQLYVEDMIWSGTSRWKPYSLAFSATGKLYANPNNNLYEIDLSSGTRRLLAENVAQVVLDSVDSGVYYYYDNGTSAYRLTSVWNENTEAEEPTQVDGEYYIENAANFLWLKNNPSAKCVLARDIQIGTEANKFTEPFEFHGTLRSIGSRKTIDAHIETASGNTGLFSDCTANGLVLDNIRLTGSITAKGSGAFTGSFLGATSNKVTINNCVNEAEVTGGESPQTGGIAGRVFNTDSVISNCINKGKVSGTNNKGLVGGIIGFSAAKIYDCGNIGKIEVINYCTAAGLAGWIGYGASLERCYNFGAVEASAYACGLVGKSDGGAATAIKNCFNAGDITGKHASVGYVSGLCYNAKTAVFTDCYSVGTLSAKTVAKTVGLKNGTFSNCYYAADSDTDGVDGTFVFADSEVSPESIGFDTTVWEKVASYPYPKLIGHDLVEAGTEIFPYIVETKEDFMAIANAPSAVYYIANDIDLGSYTPFAFSGKLYGDAAAMPTINVNIDKAGTDQIGLFSVLSGSFGIENIRLTGSVTGKYQVGGFAGVATGNVTGAHIKNCVNEAKVNAVISSSDGNSGRRAGGFVGDAFAQTNLTLSGLVNKADIDTGKSHIGGIAGISSAKIVGCANYGKINSDNCVGGFVGWYNGGYSITDSFNAGDISASEKVGGLIGSLQNGRLTALNCYNSGAITARNAATQYAGALVGHIYNGGTVTVSSCYNAGALNGSFECKLLGAEQTSTTTVNVSNCYYLKPDGDADDDSASVCINTLKNKAQTLGEGFTASENDYIFPQLAGNINTKATGDIFHFTQISTSADNGTYTAALTADASSEKECRLILALYKDGALCGIVSDCKTVDGMTRFGCEKAVSDATGITAKAMFWNEGSFKPLCEYK